MKAEVGDAAPREPRISPSCGDFSDAMDYARYPEKKNAMNRILAFANNTLDLA